MSNHSSNATADLFLPSRNLYYCLLLSFMVPVLISLMVLPVCLPILDAATYAASNLSPCGWLKQELDWTHHKATVEARFKVLLLYFLGPILLWQNQILKEEAHYVTNPSIEQPGVCDAVHRGGFCFAAAIQNAGASFLTISSNTPTTFETQFDFVKGTHSHMQLTCSAGDEMLALPQEAAYNTTKLPHVIPHNTPTQIEWADYQLKVVCFVFQPQTVTHLLGGAAVATAALSALLGFYRELDWLCSIGKPQSATIAAATRRRIAYLLYFAAVAIFVVFNIIATAFKFDALPAPSIPEMYTAAMTAIFFALCARYIHGYDRNAVDPWANLEKLFEAYSDDNTTGGLWTPASTKASEVSQQDWVDVFLAAIKTIPVQAGPYADECVYERADKPGEFLKKAGHFTIEEVWNATWKLCFFSAYQLEGGSAGNPAFNPASGNGKTTINPAFEE